MKLNSRTDNPEFSRAEQKKHDSFTSKALFCLDTLNEQHILELSKFSKYNTILKN